MRQESAGLRGKQLRESEGQRQVGKEQIKLRGTLRGGKERSETAGIKREEV